MKNNCLRLLNQILLVNQSEWSYSVGLCNFKACILTCDFFDSLRYDKTQCWQIYLVQKDVAYIINHLCISFDSSTRCTSIQNAKVLLFIGDRSVSSSFPIKLSLNFFLNFLFIDFAPEKLQEVMIHGNIELLDNILSREVEDCVYFYFGNTIGVDIIDKYFTTACKDAEVIRLSLVIRHISKLYFGCY